MLKNIPISIPGPVMNVKLALKQILYATLVGYNNLIGGMGRQYFFTQQYIDTL